MTLKPYEQYKEVNLPWLDKVPVHWDLVRNKNVMTLKKDIVGDQHNNYTLLSLTLRGIIARDMENFKGKFPKDFSTYQAVEKGDMVFCLFDIDETPRTVGLSPLNGMITSAYTVFKIKNVNKKYLYYYYLFLDNNKLLKPLYTGLRKVISTDTFLRTKIALPTRMEQDQIVKYLDFQLTKIDRFIKTKKKLISVLKEQKQAVTNEAVTKGLNPKVQMKPSGVEWLGEIPDNWETVRCKYLFREIDTRSTTGLETHLSMSQKHGLIPNEQLNERRLLSENYIGGKVCKKDDLVLNRLKAHLGVFALAPQTGVISPDYTVLRPNERIYPIYAEIVLKSLKCRRELRIRVRGIVEGFWRLYTDDFYNIILPLPKYEEQLLIVDYINQMSQSINSTIARIEKEIELITEYRTRLISDIVTGQVDVRNIEINEAQLNEIEMQDNEEELEEEILESEECEV
ncbi:hypothetical protein BKP37_09710 [Anaerobacillus alkalilacustris]|uniref:Type I restriction modification DNA specificity domain-containing protein n=1 Tax=Anaerobacillus alkalilacustris TaxID=393763 RepID=A0A1S2LMG7_9BACI|nr:restriction endonuclease subunit S [Anaerobacillus alkalilacustris]OIJ13556.1 hypothetical protein BKP37_09710 [Anaerobacillus alkalilacustris]